MAEFEVKGPDGRTFRLVGDSAPTERELEDMYAQLQTTNARSEGFDVNEGIGPMEAFKIGMGRGFNTVGRGLGLVEKEDPLVKASFQALEERQPAATGFGGIVGEGAPFAALGPAVGAVRGLGARALTAAGVGGIEGGVIAGGKGGSFNEILSGAGLGSVLGGGFEAVAPVLNRIGSEIVSRATGKAPRGALFDSAGNPTIELSIALQKEGMSLNDLADETVFAMQAASRGASPEEVARMGRFKELGIPATRGNITQNFGQQATEERLSNTASLVASEPIRALQLRQSEAFQQGVNDMVNAMGVTEETGAMVKKALSSVEAGLKSEKNELYRRMAEESPEIMSIPVVPTFIKQALPDSTQMRRLARIPGNTVDALNDLLVEFGIERTPQLVKSFQDSGGEIIPLTLGNMEEFRAALNQLGGSPNAQSAGERAMSGIVGRLKGALDEEAAALEKGLMDANVTNGSFLEPLREARGIVQRLKTEFSPQSVAGRLTDVKQDGVTPVIEASKVYDSIMGRSQPIEFLERTVKTLNDAGQNGQKAIAALQAETIMRALDDALKAPSRKTSGIQTVGYPQFVKALNSVGEDKLAVLFADNPRLLARVQMFKATAQDIMPDARATPKGSAPVILDVVNRLGRAPGIAPFVDGMKFIVNAGSDDRAVRKAMDSRPDVKRVLTHISNDYPALAAAMGIPVASVLAEEEK